MSTARTPIGWRSGFQPARQGAGARRAGAAVRVDLDGEAEVTLRVVNRGRNPDAIRPYILDPLRSGRRDGHRSEGLGLYIVEQIVRAPGGQIGVRQPDDASTEFRVALPRR